MLPLLCSQTTAAHLGRWESPWAICITVNQMEIRQMLLTGRQLGRWFYNVAQDTLRTHCWKNVVTSGPEHHWVWSEWSDLNASSMHLGSIHSCTQSCPVVMRSPRMPVNNRCEQPRCQWGSRALLLRPAAVRKRVFFVVWGFGPDGPQPPVGGECLKEFRPGVGEVGHNLSCSTRHRLLETCRSRSCVQEAGM